MYRYPPNRDWQSGVQIPLILWVCAAICAHFVMVGGGDQVAQVHEDHKALVSFASQVHDRVDVPFETDVDFAGSGVSRKDEPELAALEQKRPEEKKQPEKALAPTKAEPVKPDKTEPEKKVAAVVVKKDDQQKPLPPPPPQVDRRIAVRQHAKPNQEDNPEARFIANEANRTDEERIATITSHDRDDENPTPSGNHNNAEKNPGDSEN